MTARGTRGGFTLAEVAVTIVIVGVALLLVLQGINTAKYSARNTYNRKVALGLALQSLGEIACGKRWEELDSYMSGSYAYLGEAYEDFFYEIVLGDEQLPEHVESDSTLRYDPYRYDADEAYDEEEEGSSQPYEKVRIRVTLPQVGQYTNELLIERWLPWVQVYGEEEGEGDEEEES